MKIALDPKTTDYIAFLLDNQVKLDNMEMVIDIKLSETVLNSFYDKLDSLSSSFNNLYLDFTDKKKENEGPFANPGDRIPLCEDRIMFIKCDFIFNHLLIDIFLKEEKENKDWMRLLLLIDNFEFIFNEIGIFLNLNKNYAFILKDFSYINDMKNINEENIFDIDEKINDIYKEDSYMKRLGYTELFYDDKITLNKMEKEMNVDLGNINMFFTKDSYNFVLDFFNQFSSKYLDKIKNIFSKKEENHEDDDEEEEEEKAEEKDKKELEEIQNINNEKNENEKIKLEINNKKNNDYNDFEVVDDIFFMDDSNKNKDKSVKNKKDQKNIDSKYLKHQSNQLETIEEYGKNKKGKKRKGTDEILIDEFAVIETKTSLKRKINKKQKEEDCITYLLKLCSLRLYLFQGSDFNFENYPNKDLNLKDPSSNLEGDNDNNENNEFVFPDNSNNNEMNIDRNYLLKITDPIKKDISKKRRKRKEKRDYSNYILLNLIDLSFKIVDFSYFDFHIGKFFVDDNFENSRYKKIISKKDFLTDNSTFLLCQFELTKNEIKKKEKNKQIKETTFMRINASIPSLDIFVDQLPLNFIIKLYYSTDNNADENKSKNSSSNKSDDKKITEDKKSIGENSLNNINENNSNNNTDLELNNKMSFSSWNECLEDEENNNQDTKEGEDSLLIQEILINSFTINIHYNSHKISFAKMYEKLDWLELLTSLSDIKEFNLKFKKFNKSIPTPMSDVINELINFWKDDILSNQVANSALRGISFTRPFFKLYDGIKDLVRQPYLSYKENRGIKRGIKKGMKNFFVSFSSQGILFGEKIFRGMKIVTFRKTKLSVKKKSLYKTWVYKINKKQQDYEMYYYK